jgi:hypothetical protein
MKPGVQEIDAEQRVGQINVLAKKSCRSGDGLNLLCSPPERIEGPTMTTRLERPKEFSQAEPPASDAVELLVVSLSIMRRTTNDG